MRRDFSSGERGGRRSYVGGAVGAVVGGIGRLAVALSFLYYVLNWGGPFFHQQGGVSIEARLILGLPGVIRPRGTGRGALSTQAAPPPRCRGQN